MVWVCGSTPQNPSLHGAEDDQCVCVCVPSLLTRLRLKKYEHSPHRTWLSFWGGKVVFVLIFKNFQFALWIPRQNGWIYNASNLICLHYYKRSIVLLKLRYKQRGFVFYALFRLCLTRFSTGKCQRIRIKANLNTHLTISNTILAKVYFIHSLQDICLGKHNPVHPRWQSWCKCFYW